MSPIMSFGQPAEGLIQMAYVVQDLDLQMRAYSETLNCGPWFHLPRFGGFEPHYRGQGCRAEVALAMAFSGHLLIELIQPLDEHPSVFREVIEARGYGFHHFGRGSTDFEQDIARLRSRGFEVAFEARVGPGAGRVAYLDTHGALPGFIELIECDTMLDQTFSRFYRAALTWDRTRLVRPFFDSAPD